MIKASVSSRVLLVVGLILGTCGLAFAETPKVDGCRNCHKDEKFRVQDKKLYDYFQEWNGSVHDLAGLSCSACHGGDPDKSTKEAGHQGMLAPSSPDSPLNFSNIPKTCGGCHPKVLDNFEKSRHYAQLKSTGRGPNCVTCHGSLDARVYSMTVVQRACSKCHNSKTKNHPEIPAQADEILVLLNHANGYRKGLRFYYKSIHKPEAMDKFDAAYNDVILFWHQFDFKKLRPRAEELRAELKALYIATQEEKK
jgi:hypothetical protein